MDMVVLEKYLKAFAGLKKHQSKDFGPAPHKPILLLAMLDGIENGDIKDNLIPLSAELIVTFHEYWKLLADPRRPAPKIEFPFRYLYQEGFWHFVVQNEMVTPDTRSYTLKQLREDFDGACLSPDLWILCTDKAALDALRKHLLSVHFPNMNVVKPDVATLIDAKAEELKAQAEAKFKVKIVKEPTDEWYFVRHTLFPQVIRSLYDNQCAVCKAAAKMPGKSSIVDAAHILPFATFHNDDPRNGMALCKNHHWGFDRGWLSVTDDYTLLASQKLQDQQGYVANGTPLTLPLNKKYYPDKAALSWHRLNLFVK